MKIALITACLAGVAHSKMAALALKKEAKKRGHEIAVEEQDGHKIPIKLSKQDIAECDIVIIAKMVSISGKERFKDKTILDVSVNQAVRKPGLILDKISLFLSWRLSSISSLRETTIFFLSRLIFTTLKSKV